MCEKLIVRKDLLKLGLAFEAAVSPYLLIMPVFSAPVNQDCNKVMEATYKAI